MRWHCIFSSKHSEMIVGYIANSDCWWNVLSYDCLVVYLNRYRNALIIDIKLVRNKIVLTLSYCSKRVTYNPPPAQKSHTAVRQSVALVWHLIPDNRHLAVRFSVYQVEHIIRQHTLWHHGDVRIPRTFFEAHWRSTCTIGYLIIHENLGRHDKTVQNLMATDCDTKTH